MRMGDGECQKRGSGDLFSTSIRYGSGDGVRGYRVLGRGQVLSLSRKDGLAMAIDRHTVKSFVGEVRA